MNHLFFPDIEDDIQISHEPVAKLYRYSNDIDAHEGFLSGNIWFAGPTQNRKEADTQELNYDGHIGMLLSSLSFSIDSPDKTEKFTKKNGYNYCIEVSKVEEFIFSIKDEILDKSSQHTISWMNPEEILKWCEKEKTKKQDDTQHLSAIIDATKKFELPKIIETTIRSIKGSNMLYYDDSQAVIPLGKNAMERARGKPKRYENENEYRIWLQHNSFRQEKCIPLMHNMYQHIKLQCPSIKSYIKDIGRKT